LTKIFSLAGKTCLPYFEYLTDGEEVNYSASGLRLSDEWTKEWESDCLRTGNMTTIAINLPRIVYEAGENYEKFFKLLDSSMLMVRNAFLEKKKIIQKRLSQHLLTFLSGSTSGQQYYNENNSTYALSLIGLNEAITAFTGFNIHKGDGMKFGLEVVQSLSDYARQFSEESELRFVIAQLPQELASTRLAEMDIENYGSAKTKISGSKGSPFYTDLPTVPLSSRIPLIKRLEVESEFQELLTGGHLALICLKNKEHNSRTMHRLIKRIMENGVRFFAFVADYSYCKNCSKTFPKFLSRCPLCNSNLLSHYSRSSSIFKPLSFWNKARRRVLKKRIHYSP
jgi:ribonucleoside-triphosphate reductase